MRYRIQQRGFSLVELSVAMAVALFLLAGMFSILQSTRKTSSSQSGLAQLQDNERIALTMLTGVIEAGGYYPDPDSNDITTQLPAVGAFQMGQVVTGAANANPDLGDTLTVRYNAKANEDVIDCQGNSNLANAAAATYVNQFMVRQDAAGSAPYLACSIDGGNTWAKLVPGVAKMEVQYGVSTAAAAANTTGQPVDTYYATADMVTAAAAVPILWTNVYSLKMKLSFVNPLYSQPGQAVVPGQTQAVLPITKVIALMSRTGVDISSFK
jgi:type IV pilus assembly protein PilW